MTVTGFNNLTGDIGKVALHHSNEFQVGGALVNVSLEIFRAKIVQGDSFVAEVMLVGEADIADPETEAEEFYYSSDCFAQLRERDGVGGMARLEEVRDESGCDLVVPATAPTQELESEYLGEYDHAHAPILYR